VETYKFINMIRLQVRIQGQVNRPGVTCMYEVNSASTQTIKNDIGNIIYSKRRLIKSYVQS
jgi:hypothetical protein